MLTTTPLLDEALEFRRDAAARTPGRLAELIDCRIAQLLGVSGVNGDLPDGLPGDLSEAEELVVDLTEQFVVDVHGITDARFARLGEHYTEAEQVAIMFQLALADGFAKLAAVQPETASVLGGER